MKVGIEVFRCKLRLRFPRDLFAGSQKYLSLNLADTAENRLLAEMKAKQIELDIIAGYFDATLAKYKPHYESTKKEKTYTLLDLWCEYVQFKSNQVEQSTVIRDYSLIEKRIKALPTSDIKDAILIRNHLLSNYSAETTKRTLKQLNACCNWATASKVL